MKKLRSVFVSTAVPSMGFQKLGQPVPESNLVPDAKSGAPHPAHVYVPSSLESWYSPVKACSVPCCRRTRYCAGVRQ